MGKEGQETEKILFTVAVDDNTGNSIKTKNTNHRRCCDKMNRNRKKTKRERMPFPIYFRRHWWLYLLLLPGALHFIIFKYIPISTLFIAFQDYNPFAGFFGSPFVGWKHFRNFFGGHDFGMLLKNTLILSFMNLLFYFPVPIFFALILNEIRCARYKNLVQTMVYIPHFVSMVIVASITYTLLNENDGIVNMIIQVLTGETIPFLSGTKYFRPIILIQIIWKETGWGMIVFLAALAGVDMELYDAARVDGAGRWKRMWYITLPAIKGTIVIMLILRMGSLLNTGYDQIYLMANSLNRKVADVFDTYVYRMGVQNAQYSFSTAVGLFKGIVGCVMVLGTNWVAKKCGESGIY